MLWDGDGTRQTGLTLQVQDTRFGYLPYNPAPTHGYACDWLAAYPAERSVYPPPATLRPPLPPPP
jgi:hypothetical protein